MKKFLASLIQTGESDNVKLAYLLGGKFNLHNLNSLIPHECWKYSHSGWDGFMQRPYIGLEKPGGVGISGKLQKHILI